MAATTRFLRMITAPSCKGVFFSNILIRSWLVTSASISIPVRAYSCSGVVCSMTIRAPVRTLDICIVARMISEMVLSENLPSGVL